MPKPTEEMEVTVVGALITKIIHLKKSHPMG